MLFRIFLGATAYCALVPAALFCANLVRFRRPPQAGAKDEAGISVLIPARNEEANIGAALERVLASRDVELEVLVLDDDSSDRTGEIVQATAAQDSRVRLVEGRGLPVGWNGKQHACWTLARQATNPVLVFLDADVRVEPELLARMAAFQQQSRSALVTGFPRLITVTFLEKLLLPLIHFALLAYLPMGWMRKLRGGTRPSFAAGCGQFLMVDREAYFATGGHSGIRETMHDGLLLPKLFRTKGYRTDLADITDLASVRMYDSAAKVWNGLAKNATEGIATPGKIVPLSAILLLGQVVPIFLGVLVFGALLLRQTFATQLGSAGIDIHVGESQASREMLLILLLAILASYLPRLLAVRRFKQPLSSALLHPVGIVVLLALQWYALGRKVFGKPIGWRQRSYSSGSGAEVG